MLLPVWAPDATIRGGCLTLAVLGVLGVSVSGWRRASWTAAGPVRPRQPAISATSESTATRTTVRRNRYCRADGGR